MRKNQGLSHAAKKEIPQSHARGTEIVVEHIETYLCPSVLSADLTQVVPGSDGPLAERK